MQVSKLLGHATYTLTLDAYGDYIPERDDGMHSILAAPPASTKPAETMGKCGRSASLTSAGFSTVNFGFHNWFKSGNP